VNFRNSNTSLLPMKGRKEKKGGKKNLFRWRAGGRGGCSYHKKKKKGRSEKEKLASIIYTSLNHKKKKKKNQLLLRHKGCDFEGGGRKRKLAHVYGALSIHLWRKGRQGAA